VTDRTREIKDVLWLFAFFGALAIVFRMGFGLGATTNLSDQVPWGLWKIMNMVAGVALSTGGFMVGFLVYVLKMERLRPLVKPAILIAFLGYGSSVFALLLDIGLPLRIWHPLFMWNEHSFLFEVAWCVMLYFTITIIELSPTLLDRFHMTGVARFLHGIAPGVVIVGIALSSLHHSSLGSLFLVTPQRLHPLWYTTMLPFHFIVSAMGAGLMVVVLAKIAYAHLYDPESVFGPRDENRGALACAMPEKREPGPEGRDMPMIRLLATIACGFLAAALALKVADLFRTGSVRFLAAPTWESGLYICELLLLCAVPILLVAIPDTRKSPLGLGAAALCAAVGLVLNRVDVGIFGYFRDAGEVYIPSIAEWALSLGVIASAGLVFLYMSEYCAVFDERWEERLRVHRGFNPAFDKFSGVLSRALRNGLHRVSLLAVLILPLAWVMLYPPLNSSGRVRRNPVKPPVAKDAERKVLNIDGNGVSALVTFKHGDHRDRLGGEKSCGRCHHLSVPHDHSTPCYRCHRDMELQTTIFDHQAHFASVAKAERLGGAIPANHSCAVCHRPGEPESRRTAKPCAECHRENMSPRHERIGALDLLSACGYRKALHDTCIACHKKEAVRVNRPELPECRTCHPTYKQPAAGVSAPKYLVMDSTGER
jgi:Ni/Fe-hydrogenase subunit HybB-like protein